MTTSIDTVACCLELNCLFFFDLQKSQISFATFTWKQSFLTRLKAADQGAWRQERHFFCAADTLALYNLLPG